MQYIRGTVHLERLVPTTKTTGAKAGAAPAATSDATATPRPAHRPPKHPGQDMDSLPVRLPVDYKERLLAYCNSRDISVGDWIESQIEHKLDEEIPKVDRLPRNSGVSTTLSMRLSTWHKERLSKHCQEKGISMANWVKARIKRVLKIQ